MRSPVRVGVIAGFALTLLVACGAQPPSAQAEVPLAATQDALLPYYGSYTTDAGDIVVIARMGWFADLRDATYRTIYATGSPDHFTIGRRFEEPLPKFADLVLSPGSLTITEGPRKATAHRIAYQHTDVRIPAAGAQLAGTITEPLGAGPHPGIVVVHGSEPGQRFFYDFWVGTYTSMGLTVLTYDKRGNGSSTGTYPGEFPSAEALQTYADDAAVARDFLARWPGVDPKRVGLHGGSQGGWTVPLAMQRHLGAAFAVLVSAPATTVDQTDLWSSFSGGGASMPTQTNDEMLAAVRGNHSGYDPAPAVRALSVPTLWLLGTNDRTVPTALCVEILTALHKANFTIQMLPTGHGLLVNPTGLNAEDKTSPGLAPDLVPTLKDWISRLA